MSRLTLHKCFTANNFVGNFVLNFSKYYNVCTIILAL